MNNYASQRYKNTHTITPLKPHPIKKPINNMFMGLYMIKGKRSFLSRKLCYRRNFSIQIKIKGFH